MIDMKNIGEIFNSIVLKENPFSIGEHLVENIVSEDQIEILNQVYYSLEDYIVKTQKPKTFSGKINAERLDIYIKQLHDSGKEKIENPKDFREFNIILEKYSSLLRKKIESTCTISLKVKNLPLNHIYFCTEPEIKWPPMLPNEMKIESNSYSLSTFFDGKMKNVLIMAQNFEIGDNTTKNVFFSPVSEKIVEPSTEKNIFFQAISNIKNINSIINAPMNSTWQLDVEQFDIEQNRENHPLATFLNADPQLIESMEIINPSPTFDLKLMKYSISGAIHPIENQVLIVIHDYREYIDNEIAKTMLALCQLVASLSEYPNF
jgi:hypothetical protein